MKSNVLKSSIVTGFAAFALCGCGGLFDTGEGAGGTANGLVPPSANNQPMYALSKLLLIRQCPGTTQIQTFYLSKMRVFLIKLARS